MHLGDRIKKVREGLNFTQKELALKANISRSYLADIENNRYNPSLDTLTKIAGALDVSPDRLTGETARSLIEDRLEELSMPLSELAHKAEVPLAFLTNLDSVIPDEGDYDYVTKIAKALGVQPGSLRAALARQEPPIYDGPKSNPEEDFAMVSEASMDYACGDDWTEAELKEIERFKDFLRMKRSQKKD
ncbi:MAG TPA: hypothetical protein DEF36_11920 [Desulfotomaculum sp.]|nr:hypothetical protein [Desulfotomaculum sp.]